MKVFKYTLHPDPPSTGIDVMLPVGARVLSVGIQGDRIVCWALVSGRSYNDQPPAPRRFVVMPTGAVSAEELDRMRFVGTVQFKPRVIGASEFVFHVFTEIVEEMP